MSYIDRIKTDPVMNAVFNSRERMHRYTVKTYDNRNAASTRVWADPALDINVDEPARRDGRYSNVPSPQKYADMYGINNIPVRDATGAFVPGDTFQAVENRNVYWRHNPKLYWINMIPKDLYNINKVNKPNPIISSLKRLPVHISSLHPTFSS